MELKLLDIWSFMVQDMHVCGTAFSAGMHPSVKVEKACSRSHPTDFRDSENESSMC